MWYNNRAYKRLIICTLSILNAKLNYVQNERRVPQTPKLIN